MKTVDAETDQEIQGYWVDGRDSWLGVSVAKRVGLYFATLDLLRVWRPPVKDVESVVGKFGFVHSARPELRSIFGVTFRWIDDARRNGSKRLTLPAAVVCELLVAALSLPFASLPLDAAWHGRVEFSDACMTGLGRAWADVGAELAEEWGRKAHERGCYTRLPSGTLPSVAEDEIAEEDVRKTSRDDGVTQLVVESIDPGERFFHTAGRAKDSWHINLGEADACCWAMESRLRRPDEMGRRVVHPLDSLVCCGAFSKGRSASRRLNVRCRRSCSVQLAGGMVAFFPWVETDRNPSDAPSRRFEPAHRKKKKLVEDAKEDVGDDAGDEDGGSNDGEENRALDLREPFSFTSRRDETMVCYMVGLRCGRGRDFVDGMKAEMKIGDDYCGEVILPFSGAHGRALRWEDELRLLRWRCMRGLVRGIFLSIFLPSFVNPKKGKKPLRDPNRVWESSFGRTVRDARKVDRDNEILEFCVACIALAREHDVPYCCLGGCLAWEVLADDLEYPRNGGGTRAQSCRGSLLHVPIRIAWLSPLGCLWWFGSSRQGCARASLPADERQVVNMESIDLGRTNVIPW